MSEQFRISPAHAEDVRKVVDLVSQRYAVPVTLAGTSLGSISAAYLGINVKDPRVHDVVLTSSPGFKLGPRSTRIFVSSLPLEQLTLPVLFVHHRNDGCPASSYADALDLRARVTRSPRPDFVTVVGGDPPQSDPCEARSAHGYLGKEADVVQVIADWLRGNPVPAQIGD